MKPLSMLMASWMVICGAGCGQSNADRAAEAGRAEGQLRAEAVLPELPAECRRQAASGVDLGDRLDVALLKTDAALDRQNARTRDCAAWYDDLRAELRGGGSGPR